MYAYPGTRNTISIPYQNPLFQTGSLLLSGMVVFCGTTYYHALTEEKNLRRFTPYGGILLIMAWLSMVV